MPVLDTGQLYGVTGAILFSLGLYGTLRHRHLIRKILAVNVMGTGVFLVLVATRYGRGVPGAPDPVAQAMVLTGIVVAVSATAMAIAFTLRVHATTGSAHLPDADAEEPRP